MQAWELKFSPNGNKFNPHTGLESGTYRQPILPMRKLRLKEIKTHR